MLDSCSWIPCASILPILATVLSCLSSGKRSAFAITVTVASAPFAKLFHLTFAVLLRVEVTTSVCP